MNRPFQIRQRFVLISLLFTVFVIAMVAPYIIDSYIGTPGIQAPEVNAAQLSAQTAEKTQTPDKRISFLLDRPSRTATPRPQSLQNCTLPIEHWRDHPESWPMQTMSFGSLTLDNATMLGVISSTSDEVQIIVLRELIVFNLNRLQGVDPSLIFDTVNQLVTWLSTYGSAAAVPEPERQHGLTLAAALEAFNRGQIGPGSCLETISTPTPTYTPTPSPTLPPTLSPTPTATNTSPPPTLRPVLPFPTATNKPNPPPAPTTAPTQPPPPTAAPTQPPPPTAVPTQPPPPTAVPTSVPTPTSPP